MGIQNEYLNIILYKTGHRCMNQQENLKKNLKYPFCCMKYTIPITDKILIIEM